MAFPKPHRTALLLAVAASGVSGLTWELLWQHHAGLALGVSAFGTAITLASMMAGLGLGGLLAACLALRGRLRQPLVAYGYAEVVVGLGALVVPVGLGVLARLDTAIYSASPELAAVSRVAGTALLLLLPATAMGATIPILAAYAARAGTRIATIYACNLLGAVAGVLAATFLLLPAIGVAHTGLLTAGVNLAVALWAISSQRSSSPEGPSSSEVQAAAGSDSAASVSAYVPDAIALPQAGALGLAFTSGLVIFILEVSWFRSLRAALQSTTESFALILAAFLIALALGGWLVTWLETRLELHRPSALDPVLPVAACAVLVTTPLVDSIDRWSEALGSSLIPAAFSLSIAAERLAWVLAAVLLPVTLLGMIFPWLLARHPSTVGAGRLYAVNTLGSVSGALLAGFVLLPRIGSTYTSWFAGLVVLVPVFLGRRGRLSMALAVVLGGLGLGIAFQYGGTTARLRVQGKGSDVYSEVLYVAEGPDSTVWVARDRASGNLDLVIDGFAATGEAPGASYMQWMGHLPALAVPRVEHALVICFGTGQTADSVRRHQPDALQLVDISAAVFGAAPFFRSNGDVLNDPDVEAVVMDGRSYLRRTDLAYDLVTLEPMPPNFAGSNNLYSREFYELIRLRLKPEGVAAQWLPIHLLAPRHMRAVVTTFQGVFPYTRLWLDPASKTGILVGGGEPWELRDSPIPLPLPAAAVSENFLLGWDEIAAFAEDGPLITDDNQLLAYGRDRFRRVGAAGQSWYSHLSTRNRWILYQARGSS